MIDRERQPVTMEYLDRSLDLVRAEQKNEHTKTRAVAVAASLVGPTVISKVLALLGVIHVPF